MHCNSNGHKITRPLILSAGFPCQDASIANPKGLGTNGERTGLFREVIRIMGEMEPEYTVLENVSNILIRGWDDVITSIAEIGYSMWYRTISATEIGYPFQGKRIYAIAFSSALIIGLEEIRIFDEYFKENIKKKATEKQKFCRELSLSLQPEAYAGFYAETIGLSPYLVPIRLHAAGNAVIPDFSEIIFKTIKEFHEKIIEGND